jgi:hypothetical protein
MKIYTASCHCHAVKIVLNHKPDFINDCNCSLCSKAEAIWGYYHPRDVQISGETGSFTRVGLPNPAVEIHFCKGCQTTTHWVLTETYKQGSGVTDTMGVNMHLFDESELQGVELRFPDGKAWFGEGEYGYRKKPVIIRSKSV